MGRNGLEASASIEIAKHTLVSGGLILAIGTLTGLLAQKIKIPDVALFLIVGMLIGPDALGLINIKADSALNQIILLFGASYILFDGGASLRLDVLKQVWITIVVIATVGVVITAVVTGIAAYFVLGVPLIVALLLGATLSSTDPATLVPIVQQVHIRDRVAQTVMSESAFNDAMGAIVTFGVLAVATGAGEFSWASSLFDLLKQSIVGIVAGTALGYAAAFIIAHERWSFLEEYAPVVISQPMACRPAGLWRCSCLASCSATRTLSASGCKRASKENLRNLSQRPRSLCGSSSLFYSVPRSISV